MTDQAPPMICKKHPAFIACVVVLTAGLLGMSALERAMGLVLHKEPLPLRKSLADLDRSQLAPYRVVETFSIDDPDLLRSLGTTDYIQWVLEDTRREAGDPAREVLLFVTYYALPDKVPHVPEECYLGSGFQRLAAEPVSFASPQLGQVVPGRRLVFGQGESSAWSQDNRVSVLYLFRVNDQYAGNRDDARLALNKNLFGKASFFSKVELVFNRSPKAITASETQAAAQGVLDVVLPMLESTHWPLWPTDSVGH